MKNIKSFPRINIGCYPTPFYLMKNLSNKIGLNLFIKREDLSGIGIGGNKIRKLEFLLADAKLKNCDTVITTGAAQSNHAMLTAAACRALNLEPILVLKKRGVTALKGNLLLNHILNTKVHFVDIDDYEDVYKEMNKIAKGLITKGKKPYIIPLGGSVPLGVLGYVNAVSEMLSQAEQKGIAIEHIVCASGSGGIQAGLIVGTKLFNRNIKVTGIEISPEEGFAKIVADLANGTLKLLESELSIKEEDVVVKEYIGPGYACPSPEGTEAIKLVARTEGIILDPVYTGKAFGGLMSLAKEGYFNKGDNIVFMHTGGIPALFAIESKF